MSRIVLFTILLSAFVATSAMAVVPGLISYQGTLTDENGIALDTTVAMTFSIYTDSTGGAQMWTETQPSVEVDAGIFNVLLGRVNAIDDSVFDDPERWLGIQVGGDAEMSPRERFASVPYALKTAGGGGGDDGDWIISGDDMSSGVSGNVGIGTTNFWCKFQVKGAIPDASHALAHLISEDDGTDDVRSTLWLRRNPESGPISAGYGTSLDVFLADCIAGNFYWTTQGGQASDTDFRINQRYNNGLWTNMMIEADGDVGIGTTWNLYRFTIKQSSDYETGGLAFQGWDGNNFAALGLDGNENLKLWTYDNGSGWYERAVVDVITGDIGIGTSSNLYKFTIKKKSDGVDGGLAFQGWNGDNFAALNLDLDENLRIWTFTGPEGWHDRLIINSVTGNVGVGNMDPTSRLDVESDNGYDQLRMRTSYTPGDTDDPNGIVGDVAWDNDYIYIKTDDGWKRAALSTW